MRSFTINQRSLNCILFFSILQFQTISINAENILVVIMFGSKSHKYAFDPLFEELAARGHNITTLSSFKPSKKFPNITDIKILDVDETVQKLPNPFDIGLKGKTTNTFDRTILRQQICRAYHEHPRVQSVLKQNFDLIFINAFAGECSYGFISHFKTKSILLSSMPAPTCVSNTFGTPTLPSLNSVFVYGYPERMTFLQRTINFFGHIYFHYDRNYRHVPEMEKVYREYFPNAPSVLEIEREANLMLINSHPSMNPSMLLLPDMIEIGGMHCRKAKPLPNELQDFLDGAGEDGFIYFSMGSFLQGTSMPEQYRRAFVQAFSKLKQRVLWKYEDDELPDRPVNVKTGKWLPQQDILGHPNIKLFITHGGLLSGQEAVYHGVPLLGIPLIADQHGNMEQALILGYALKIELIEITEELILGKVKEMLSNRTYSDSAKKVSRAFQDRPESPLKTAVFWTEFILRQKDGAKHLRSVGRDLNFVVFNSIDVIATLFLAIGLTTFIIHALSRYIYSQCKLYSELKLHVKQE